MMKNLSAIAFIALGLLAKPAFCEQLDLGVGHKAKGKLLLTSGTGQLLIQLEEPFDFDGQEFTVHAPVGSFVLARRSKSEDSSIFFFRTCENISATAPRADCSDELGTAHFHGIEASAKEVSIYYGLKISFFRPKQPITLKLPEIGGELNGFEWYKYGNIANYSTIAYEWPEEIQRYKLDHGTVNVRGKTVKINFVLGLVPNSNRSLRLHWVYFAEDTVLDGVDGSPIEFKEGQCAQFTSTGLAFLCPRSS